MVEETAVFAFWCFDTAHRAAIDTGGRDAGEKAPVKPRVTGLEREVASALRSVLRIWDPGVGVGSLS